MQPLLHHSQVAKPPTRSARNTLQQCCCQYFGSASIPTCAVLNVNVLSQVTCPFHVKAHVSLSHMSLTSVSFSHVCPSHLCPSHMCVPHTCVPHTHPCTCSLVQPARADVGYPSFNTEPYCDASMEEKRKMQRQALWCPAISPDSLGRDMLGPSGCGQS